MSIRKDFIGFSSSFSGLFPLDVLSALTGQDFIIPFYHLVSDEDCPHISGLYKYKNTRQFEADLDYLASHYQPIGASDLNDVLAGKYRGERIMLLTFDDGFRQIYEIVAPMLVKKGIPAVFFLNTDFIDNKALMFRCQSSLAMVRDPRRYKVLPIMEDGPDLTGMKELDQIFEAFLREYQPYMTSSQIKSLIGQGFAIGAHSCSHPYYKLLSMKEQLAQTLNCIDILKQNFGIAQRLFAFPFTDDGVSKAFFTEIFDSGKVDFSFGGAGIKNDIHPRQFQRIPMEGWEAAAEQILKSEYLYYLLRAPFFKNRIKRL